MKRAFFCEYYVRGDILDKKIVEEIREIVKQCMKYGEEQRCKNSKDYYRNTERRLYAHKQLVRRVKQHMCDIEDLRKEGKTGKSKDIVIMQNSGVRLDDEDILKAKILTIHMKIDKDMKEIEEIKRALQSINKIQYQEIIHYKYFEEMSDTKIAEKMHLSERTVRRKKKELMNRLMVALYGAEVI